MALFNRHRFCALVSTFMLSAVLAGCGGGGGDGTPAAAGGGGDGNNSGNPPRLQTLTTGTLTAEQRTGTAEDNVFTITGDMTDRALTIDGAGGTNSFVLASGDVVRDIVVSAENPAAGDVHLQNIERIELRGGTVRNITGATDFFSEEFEAFNIAIGGDLTSNSLNINGIIDGGGVEGSFSATFSLGIRGLFSDTPGVVRDIAFTAGDAAMGDVHLQNIISINLVAGTVRNIIGSIEYEQFIITGDLTSDHLNINGIIDGGDVGGNGFVLNSGGVVRDIAVSNTPPAKGDVHLQNMRSIALYGGTVRNIIGSSDITDRDDRVVIVGDLTSDELNINGIIDGGAGDDDELELHIGRVRNIAFSTVTPSKGDVHLQNIESFFLAAGRVNGNIDALNASAGIEFNLLATRVSGNVVGSPHDDTFNLYSFSTIGGYLDGGAGTDVLRYEGAPSGTGFAGRGGLAADSDTNDNGGSVRNIESQVDDSAIFSLGAGLRGLTVSGIEVLGLSPALNLYGALSDALMQFGQQTAQGFALADLNLATGRATSLASKDSPFTKGRIWAHKITHSGNGKGSIGLGLTGLTARADNDYDYEMSLTQHGFDAPVATTKLGAFNLRAVSHTMTGVIETNVAQAKVSGYGAGLAMMWNNETLSAHITSLAGAYEVEATTSSLNPRAVVSEVSEGSFSAINAVVSAGVADTRKIGHSLVLRTTADISWQTLSLDDFNETGADGIAVNFDKATRFTARVGAGLEAEHWFSDVVFVHETSSGGTLSSGLSQDYRQDDGTAIEMKLGGKVADLATGLTLKAHIGLRTSFIGAASIEPSGHLALNWRF